MEEAYFFDTYAAIAMFDGSENYKRYRKARAVVIDLNLFEIDYCLRRRGERPDVVSQVLEQYSTYIARYDLKSIRGAVSMKLLNKRLSPVDCIGYQVAQEYGVKFLTGDKEFEGMAGVEFVK